MKDTKKVSELRNLINYNPVTGIFTFKEREGNAAFNTRYANQRAGYINESGYEVIGIKGKAYLAHRLAYALMTGKFPPKNRVIDHKFHVRSDNRWSELRKCTHSQNACSTFSKGRGRSYFKGVSFCKQSGMWLSRITKNNKIHFIGRFKRAFDAAKAYDGAASVMHGQFATLNFNHR